MIQKILSIFFFCSVFMFGGAGFESESYLIWINSKCPVASTTCKAVTYNQTNKSNKKTIIVQGGEPIVGNLSGNLIGYKFFDTKTNQSFELSMDLNGEYTLYVRVLDGVSRSGKGFKQEKIKALDKEVYLQKIQNLKK
ncbi:hypothetical protein CQA53_05185 [Helicobacter didelphidarum]|uniref:Uncharacterized protein n=1 Tax=Helicobacter didelphidarum TaxID=2040648 RepID=A0A3D8ILX3_9HELI|nr:hypothetical protein [Helicobacter didelphidarum]RDU66010.1 hypothetical protein CQA53_05185 [Helicobacter didelphidarum]